MIFFMIATGSLAVCMPAYIFNDTQAHLLMAAVADKVTVHTSGIAHKCFVTVGTFHFNLALEIFQRRTTYQASCCLFFYCLYFHCLFFHCRILSLNHSFLILRPISFQYTIIPIPVNTYFSVFISVFTFTSCPPLFPIPTLVLTVLTANRKERKPHGTAPETGLHSFSLLSAQGSA